MESLAQQLSRLAAAALELEDKILRKQARRNSSVYSQPEKQPGILRFNNEHYYQFVVARHLVGTVPYRVKAEVKQQDLILWKPEATAPFASIEMKRWMSAKGEREIDGIRRDMVEKLASSEADHRIMMVFSANPIEAKDSENLHVLAGLLGDRHTDWCQSKFQTISENGDDFVFWVATREILPNLNSALQ